MEDNGGIWWNIGGIWWTLANSNSSHEKATTLPQHETRPGNFWRVTCHIQLNNFSCDTCGCAWAYDVTRHSRSQQVTTGHKILILARKSRIDVLYLCYLCIVFISIAASYWISYYAMHSLCMQPFSFSRQGTAVVQETERCWETSPRSDRFACACNWTCCAALDFYQSSQPHAAIYVSRPDLTRSGILLKSARDLALQTCDVHQLLNISWWHVVTM